MRRGTSRVQDGRGLGRGEEARGGVEERAYVSVLVRVTLHVCLSQILKHIWHYRYRDDTRTPMRCIELLLRRKIAIQVILPYVP